MSTLKTQSPGTRSASQPKVTWSSPNTKSIPTDSLTATARADPRRKRTWNGRSSAPGRYRQVANPRWRLKRTKKSAGRRGRAQSRACLAISEPEKRTAPIQAAAGSVRLALRVQSAPNRARRSASGARKHSDPIWPAPNASGTSRTSSCGATRSAWC